MKKENITLFHRCCWIWLVFLVPYVANAQVPDAPTLSCSDKTIALGEEMDCGCVSPGQLLNQDITPIDETYWKLILKGDGAPGPFFTTNTTGSANSTMDCFDGIDETVLSWWDYELHLISEGDDGEPATDPSMDPEDDVVLNKCWGHVTFEDKIPPVVTCTPPDVSIYYVYKYDWPKVKAMIEEWADGEGCGYFDDHCMPDCGKHKYGPDIDDVSVHYIPFNGIAGSGEPTDQNANIQLDEECMWVALYTDPGNPPTTPPSGPIGEDYTGVPTTTYYEWSSCIEDNCQTSFDVKWRLTEDLNPIECPYPGGEMTWWTLEYYIEWTSIHTGTQEVSVAKFLFHVLRPPAPKFPHDVTVYCGYGADEDGVQIDKTPYGIAKQYNRAFYCGEEYFAIWEDACTEEEYEWMAAGCNVGIPYAYPHWEIHDDVTVHHDVEGIDIEYESSCYIPLEPDGSHGYCKYFAIYEDTPLLQDCCVYKLLRKWTIVDWCTSTHYEDWQVVERHDHKGPELHGHPYGVEIGIKPWLCYASVEIPDSKHYPYIEAWDACCDAYVNVSIHEFNEEHVAITQAMLDMPAEAFMEMHEENICDYASEDPIDGYEELSIGDVVSLGKGRYVIKYQGIDECGNAGEYFCAPLWVLDKTPPVPVCEDEVVVSLTPDGGLIDGGVAKAYATSFNNHSHDAGCGDVWYGIMRMDDFNTDKVYDCYGYFIGWEGGSCEGANQNIAYYPMDGYDKNGYPECDDDYAYATNFCHVLSPYGQDVKFCCEDYGDDNLWVVMRVWDEGHFNPEAFTEYGYPYHYGYQGGYTGGYGDYMNDHGEEFYDYFPSYHGYIEQSGVEYAKWVWNPYYGNYNDCMVKVTIQNKISATIICAKNTYYYCDQYPDTPEDAYVYAPTVDALCGDVDMKYNDIVDLDDCQYGVVYRVWTAYAGEEVVASCTQHIYIGAHEAFDPRTIKWPPHQTGEHIYANQIECVDDLDHAEIVDFVPAYLPPHLDCAEATTCIPEWDDRDCGLVGWSLEADTIYFEDQSCMKIINHWTVIDWCTWQPNCQDDFDEQTDEWAWFEDWSLGDCTKPSCYNDGVYNLYASFVADCTVQYGEIVCKNDVYPPAQTHKYGYHYECDYSDMQADGYYVWDQIIKVINTTPPVLADCEDKEFEAVEDCEGWLVLENSATDEGDCGSNWLKWHVELFDVHWHLIDYWDLYSGSGETVRIDKDNDPDGWDYDNDEELHQYPGTYIVRWTVSDGCNNEAVCIQYLNIVDRKPPTPICFGTISTALMQPSGEVTIWASDFEQKSFDNCTPDHDDGELEYSIKLSGSDDEPAASIDIDCETLTTNPLTLQMYVTDAAGNSDWCEVFLFVSDESGICGETGSGTAMVSGQIKTEFGDQVEGVMVSIEGLGGSHRYNMMTAEDGQYAFANNPMFQDYTVKAEKDGDDMNGVSTLDLVLISRHITGAIPLNSPYKVIAADVNADQEITSMDIVELRKLILGKYDDMPENTSWRFVDASQTLEVTDPFPFAEVIKIEKLDNDRLAEDFIAIKIGDVNESVKANEAVDAEIRNQNALTLVVDESNVDAGQLIRIDVSADNFSSVYGYQFTMNHSGMTLQSVEAGALNVTDANVGVREGLLTMSWNETNGVSTTDVLFSLTFMAEESATLSDVLSISSNVTTAEAYVGAGLEAQDVNLVFRTEEGTLESAVFELYQNEPNPFDNETLISFTLPRADKAMITIMDVTGKTVKVVQGEYPSGYNEIRLKSEDLGAGGVFYYQLNSGTYTALKKMVFVR